MVFFIFPYHHSCLHCSFAHFEGYTFGHCWNNHMIVVFSFTKLTFSVSFVHRFALLFYHSSYLDLFFTYWNWFIIMSNLWDTDMLDLCSQTFIKIMSFLIFYFVYVSVLFTSFSLLIQLNLDDIFLPILGTVFLLRPLLLGLLTREFLMIILYCSHSLLFDICFYAAFRIGNWSYSDDYYIKKIDK